MKRILSALAVAAVSVALQRYLARAASRPRRRTHSIESWENEGGALAPQRIPVPSSQVPR